MFDVLTTTLSQFWYLALFVLISYFLRTAWFKGWFGELLLSLSFKLFLDGKLYRLVNDVTLPCKDGTTQVDHVLISPFGIFVVETKNMKGWIFGSEQQKQWMQQIYRHRSKFQNPLRQNYNHLKALESSLDLKPTDLFSVVCFVGDATFKTAMPENVTHIRGCLHFIRSKQERMFSESEVAALVSKLEELKLKRGFKPLAIIKRMFVNWLLKKAVRGSLARPVRNVELS